MFLLFPISLGLFFSGTNDTSEYNQISKKFMGTLAGVLMKTIKTEGPAKAVSVCSDTAIALTEKISEESGMVIKRVTFKTRNPLNKPDKYENNVLRYFQKLKEENKLNSDSEWFEETQIEGSTYGRFLKPIVIKKQCLTCHGDENKIADDVKQIINEKYPNDNAINYKAGELRGAISIIKKLD